MQLLKQIVEVNSTDADVQRRGRMLIIITIGMALTGVVSVLYILLARVNPLMLLTMIAAEAIFIGVIVLGRAGRVNLGSYLLIGVTVLGVAGGIPVNPQVTLVVFFMALPVLFAGMLLPPGHVWGIFVFAASSNWLGSIAIPPAIRTLYEWNTALFSSTLMLLIVSLVSFLSARTTSKALVNAEHATRALAESNAALEARVEERTAALRQVAEDQSAVAAKLRASLAAQNDLNRVIATLSVPIIPISAGTLVVPLVGNLDSDRTRQLLSAILERLEETGARTVVVDVTGVAVVDTYVAGALLKVAGAARLMGAETMLVGIRPEVAQTLVQLGVDLGGLHTAATLQDGLHAIGVMR